MKKLTLLPLFGMLLFASMAYAQPTIYSSSAIYPTGPGAYDTYKCAQGATTIWTDSIYPSYTWSTGDTTPLITLNTTGSITLTTSAGTSTVLVIQDQLANQNTLYAQNGTEACDGDVLELQTFTDPPGWVLWSWGDTVFNDNDCDVQYFPGCGMNRTTSGNYSYLRYNGTSGCYYNSFNILLNFYPEPAATITQSNDTLYANAPGANSYQWLDASQSPIPNATNAWYQPSANGNYYVEASFTYGAGSCSGPTSAAYNYSSNCFASYYSFPDTSSQFSIIIVNTSVPSPGPNVTYAWDFGDGSTSSLAFPQHTYAGPGTYYICVTVSDGTCSSTYCDSITVTSKINVPFSINVVDPGSLNAPTAGSSALEWTAWPQPADEKMGFDFFLADPNTVSLKLHDLQGRKVGGIESLDLSAGQQELRMDCAGLPPGVYLARLHIGDRSYSKKVSILR